MVSDVEEHAAVLTNRFPYGIIYRIYTGDPITG